MSKIVTFCLGLILLTVMLPDQVHCQSTIAKPNASDSSTANSTHVSNTSGVSPVTTSTNTTTARSHGDSLYASSSLFLSLVSISVIHLYC
ncbi:Hypothetical predicted protein [Pelobates cultripes]|uniref:CD24 n=1 Tax=Pelobates cultripes TaxID=61616 RepID=A0AAD1RG01_PELCU|nr:Hypothetical predicted protein [Pelobates cultripes]